MTTSMIAWLCTMQTPTTTSTDTHMSSARIVSSVAQCHIICTRTVAQVTSLSFHPHGHGNLSVSPHLDSPFLFPALPHAPFLLPPAPEVRRQPVHSAQREYGLPSPQVMSPTPTTSTRPQSSPTCSSWTRRRSSPTKSLLRTPTMMTLHSRIRSTKYLERKPITLYEKTCLLICRRRQCPIERGDPFEIERGDPLINETRKHRLGLCSTSKKSKFLQSAKQELTTTRISSSSSRRRATTSSRTIIAAKLGIT